MLLNSPAGFLCTVVLQRDGQESETLNGLFARIPVAGDLLPMISKLAISRDSQSFARVTEVALNALNGLPAGHPVALVKATWE